MKTVTMDFETYESEIKTESFRGFNNAKISILKALETINGEDYSDFFLALFEVLEFSNNEVRKIAICLAIEDKLEEYLAD